VDIWQLRYNLTALFLQFLQFEAEGTLKDIRVLIAVRVAGLGEAVPIIFLVVGGFWFVMMGFEVGGDGGVEVAGSPALFLGGVEVVFVAGEDVAQHEGKKIYYKLTSAD